LIIIYIFAAWFKYHGKYKIKILISQEMDKNNVELLKSIPDGGTLALPASSFGSIDALRNRASELNAIDGWKHYVVRYSRIENKIILAAFSKEEEEL
jgi:hypothetical protein